MALVLALLTILTLSSAAQAANVPLTILHTNDLHSKYEPDTNSPYGLGGIARIKTLVDRVRSVHPNNTLFLDGGDWSEGHSFYNLEGGRTSIEMMNRLGYDAAVIGNHDWLNGPDQLLSMLALAQPRFALLAANIDFNGYAHQPEFQQAIPPSTVIMKGGLKIGVIGAVTYEFIFDRYLMPITPSFPFPVVRSLALDLKTNQHCDVVVVISHNNLYTSRYIAMLPNVDVVIHAHDHTKIAEPEVIEREGKTSYLVEAEKWGHYLGELNLMVNTEKKTVMMTSYRLHQVDSTIPSDPAIVGLIRSYKHELASLFRRLGYPGIFRDRVVRNSDVIDSAGGRENRIGNLAADAYRFATGADIAFEHAEMISAPLAAGWLHTFDFLNALTSIFNPTTTSGWTVHTVQFTGASLRGVMMLVYLIQDLIPGGLPSVSGLHAIFDPAVVDGVDPGRSDEVSPTGIRLLEVAGHTVRDSDVYNVAMSNGILHAIDFIENRFNYRVERSNLHDTGIETWRALRDYTTQLGGLFAAVVNMGDRFQVLSPDLAVYPNDMSLIKNGDLYTHLRVTVHNYGAAPSHITSIRAGYDRTPDNTVDDPNIQWASAFSIPTMAAGSSRVMTLPLHRAVSSLTGANYIAAVVQLNSAGQSDVYSGNDQATRVWRQSRR